MGAKSLRISHKLAPETYLLPQCYELKQEDIQLFSLCMTKLFAMFSPKKVNRILRSGKSCYVSYRFGRKTYQYELKFLKRGDTANENRTQTRTLNADQRA